MMTNIAYADDQATFETMYNPATPTNWFLLGLGAVAAGALVFFTAGLASPFVAAGVSSIGTAIGGVMGFTGAAATSAGLAFLGGGSIAAGGFGMAGGAALLTTVITFGTEVVFDKSIDYMTQTSVDLSTASKGRVDLRFPVYKKGSDDLREVSEYLESNIDTEEMLDGAHNRTVLSHALEMCKVADYDGIKEELQVKSAAAMIALILDDYQSAYSYADQALRSAQTHGEIAPVASYILGVSSLNVSQPSGRVDHYALVKSALLTEQDESSESFFHGMTPLLFSVYADRLQLQIMRGNLRASEFNHLIELIKTLKHNDQSRFMSSYPIATRQLILLKWFQNKIENITQTDNSILKQSPKALKHVKLAFEDYHSLAFGLNQVAHLLKLSVDQENESKVNEIYTASKGYNTDIDRLRGMIKQFELNMHESKATYEKPNEDNQDDDVLSINGKENIYIVGAWPHVR